MDKFLVYGKLSIGSAELVFNGVTLRKAVQAIRKVFRQLLKRDGESHYAELAELAERIKRENTGPLF